MLMFSSYIHCGQFILRNSSKICATIRSTIARLGHCVDDIGHWMAANRLQMNPARLSCSGPAPNTTSRCWVAKPQPCSSTQTL